MIKQRKTRKQVFIFGFLAVILMFSVVLLLVSPSRLSSASSRRKIPSDHKNAKRRGHNDENNKKSSDVVELSKPNSGAHPRLPPPDEIVVARQPDPEHAMSIPLPRGVKTQHANASKHHNNKKRDDHQKQRKNTSASPPQVTSGKFHLASSSQRPEKVSDDSRPPAAPFYPRITVPKLPSLLSTRRDIESLHPHVHHPGHVRTYDDVLATSIATKHYMYNSTMDAATVWRRWYYCDPIQVPFSPSMDERCEAFLRAAVEAASLHRTLPAVVRVSVATRERQSFVWVNVSFDPMSQRFEQRTIKFKLKFDILSVPQAENGNEYVLGSRRDRSVAQTIYAILKVPQILFPIEPFAEVAALNIDRLLRIHRVPPTVFTSLSVGWIKQQSAERHGHKDPNMVQEFLEASQVKSYDEWIDKDFVSFVQKPPHKASGGNTDEGSEGSASKYMLNKTHVWCSIQLFLTEAQPILYSPLKVPYSKSNPGWHRWFDVEFKEYVVPYGPLLALSELAIFDCIIMNNDRSPNKNNFIVGGCKNCPAEERRPSGLVPTIVHLDHGMSFYGKGVPISHNPLGKQSSKVRFCIFYRPLVNILQRLHNSRDVGQSEEGWRRLVLRSVHPIARRVIGEDRIGDVGTMVTKVLNRLEYCISTYNETAVLRP